MDGWVHLLLPASSKFCYLLMIFANSLDPDQAGQSGSMLFDTPMLFPKEYFEKKNVENERQKNMKNYPACKELRPK